MAVLGRGLAPGRQPAWFLFALVAVPVRAVTAVAGLRGPTALAHEARPCVLAQEDRQSRGALGAADALHGRVAAGDQDAAPRVDRVREEVAKATVLPGGHARGPALANEVGVDHAAGGVHDLLGRVLLHRAQDRGVVDRR